MLDQGSVLDRKSTGKAVNAEGSNRHLSQEDLEGYANGRLASARSSYCGTHLDACEACRAELEDIRNLQTELAAFTPRAAGQHVPERLGRRRSVALPVTAAIGAVLVAGVGGVLWWKHGKAGAYNVTAAVPVAGAQASSDAVSVAPVPAPAVTAAGARSAAAPTAAPVARAFAPPNAAPAARPSATALTAQTATLSANAPVTRPAATLAAMSVARASAPPVIAPVARTAALPATPIQRSAIPAAVPNAPVSAGIPTRDARLAEDLAALPADLRASVSDAIQHGKLQLPPDVRPIHNKALVSGQAAANTGFSLLGPFGEATSDTRPKFTWQPFPGAIGYSVAIVDPSLRPVQHSPALRATAWRPHRPLARGRTYLWQVTATLHGGTKVVASSPSPSEAFLRTIPRKLADEMAHFQRGHKDAHLVLGVVYAQAGMLTEGTNELNKVAAGDPSYNDAHRLLQSLPSGRQ